ncbi:hypothetical protein CCM_00687 [Cordyceps militaris CM01]|uniref:Uncharacterized protein n=1 Tax=Cordyceps militaris (strain CM01) TaxID=983644 RepID=G3J5H1_CORMM|nr:uncharacterized protein CCM_00687 [Cordyceps militaris CM01]EGX96032.1 hypothetical protein CCM_00687 [Cordyceps militaris CM01]
MVGCTGALTRLKAQGFSADSSCTSMILLAALYPLLETISRPGAGGKRRISG